MSQPLSYKFVSTCQHIIMNSALLSLSSCLVIVTFCGQTSSVRLPITFLTSWDTCFMMKELRAKRQSSCASSWCPATLYPVTGFSTSIFYAVLKPVTTLKQGKGRETKRILLLSIHNFHSFAYEMA
jgi:hypothetical protein